MYLLTNKALEKREQDAWAKGNSDATKAWQYEFEQQAKEYSKLKSKYMDSLDEIENLKMVIESFKIL